MRKLLFPLLIILGASACGRSGPHYRVDLLSSPLIQEFTPFNPRLHLPVTRIWNQLASCAGFWEDKSKTLDQVKFFRRSAVSDLDGNPILGEWVAPDSVFITRGYEASAFILAHELLHHKLNGVRNGTAHPDIPFRFPCELNVIPDLYEWSAPRDGTRTR